MLTGTYPFVFTLCISVSSGFESSIGTISPWESSCHVISANQHFASTFSMQVFKFQRPSCKLSFLSRPAAGAPRGACSQASSKATNTHKTNRNPPIANHKPWPFEPVEVNVCFLRGPLESAKPSKIILSDGTEIFLQWFRNLNDLLYW